MDGRVLKPMPADLRIKMDALVHDLTQALEESSCTSSVRIRMGSRRRARSTGNISMATEKTHSDESISERLNSRSKELSSFVQSDSDEVSPNSQNCLTPFPLQKRMTNLHLMNQNFESDSVNENFSPSRTGTRRKRKMKRMDVDSIDQNLGPPRNMCVSSITRNNLSLPGPSGIRTHSAKKKRILKTSSYLPQRLDSVMGKRKRNTRERNSDSDVGNTLSKACRYQKDIRLDDNKMEIDKDLMSSSSLSSSESDAGIYTNDEGREGDDEQSDWFGEVRWDEDTDLEQDDPTFQQLLSGSLDPISTEARQAYKERIQWLRDGLGGREIRGGRRRIRDERPGFSVFTSANEKLSKFLQDCEQVTLKLHPMSNEEREQLSHLIKLYSLNMITETANNGLSCPIITKTNHTPQAIRIDDVSMNISDYKKRRKIPQCANTDYNFETKAKFSPSTWEAETGICSRRKARDRTNYKFSSYGHKSN